MPRQIKMARNQPLSGTPRSMPRARPPATLTGDKRSKSGIRPSLVRGQDASPDPHS